MKLPRLPTSVATLDQVMDGGFPTGSVSVLAGEPGAGKTVLALQTLFAAARDGKRCLYFTTLSEPSLKLMRYMQLFDFFDEDLLREQIHLHDLGNSLRAHDPEAALNELSSTVEQIEPDLVVIDSFKAVHDLISDARRVRTFTYDLAVQMGAWGATTLLLGEYQPEDIGTFPEFAIADGIIRLGVDRQELARVRSLEIHKLRGSQFVSGTHFFEIGPAGFAFYPRVRAPDFERVPSPDPASERLSTGVSGLDELLGGGIPHLSNTVIMGGTGTGKTLLGLHFLVEGARKGEIGVLFTLEETLDQLRGISDSYGFDLRGLEEQGLIHLVYTPPIELSTDKFLDRAREIAHRVGARRAVLDSLSSLSLGAVSERRYKELVYALGKHFRTMGVTLVSTMEVVQLLGAPQISGHGVSFAADNVIHLRYLEVQGRLDRAISVIKARGSEILTELRPATIAADGMHVSPAEELLRRVGVVSGVTQA